MCTIDRALERDLKCKASQNIVSLNGTYSTVVACLKCIIIKTLVVFKHYPREAMAISGVRNRVSG